MIFWYDSLYMDDAVRKNEKKCRKIIERRSMWQKLPFKKSYFVLILANNGKNLFEIMNTNQMFFRYYGYTNLYILGVARDYDGAVEILRHIMTKGYEKNSAFNPRAVFQKSRFTPAKSSGK